MRQVMSNVEQILAAVVLLSSGTQGHAAPASRCSEAELVVFSCSTGKNLASVCLAASGALQYRFGTIGEAPKWVYPAKPEGTNAAFRFQVQDRSAKGSISNLQFNDLATTYTIYRFAHSFEGNYAGIAIAEPNKPLKRLACKESSVVATFSRPEVERLGPVSPVAIVE